MMLWKYCTQYASKFGKLSSGHRTGKGQFSFQSQRKAMPKNAQTTTQLHSSHTIVKWCSKIFQTRLQEYMKCELPDVQGGFRKAEELKIQLPTSTESWKKQESSRRNIFSALLTMPKPLIGWIKRNCGKFFKRWEYQTTWPASWESVCRSGGNS